MATRTARPGFFDVMTALILREMQSRYGDRGLSYIWGILEPAMYVAVAVLWFSVTNRIVMVGMPISLFLMTGIAPYILFYRVDQFVRTSIIANTGLLYHPSIAPLHLMLGRFFLEGPTEIFFLCFVFVGYGIGWNEPRAVPVDFGPIIEALGLDLLFAFGVGGAIAPIMIRFPGVGWTLGFLVRIIFMTAGVHYVPDYAPTAWQPIIFWNPMTHIITLFRTGFIPTFPSHHLSPLYALTVGGGLLLTALWLERYFGRQWIEA
jgi:capsular polysaccharide transport system permease protein